MLDTPKQGLKYYNTWEELLPKQESRGGGSAVNLNDENKN